MRASRRIDKKQNAPEETYEAVLGGLREESLEDEEGLFSEELSFQDGGVVLGVEGDGAAAEDASEGNAGGRAVTTRAAHPGALAGHAVAMEEKHARSVKNLKRSLVAGLRQLHHVTEGLDAVRRSARNLRHLLDHAHYTPPQQTKLSAELHHFDLTFADRNTELEFIKKRSLETIAPKAGALALTLGLVSLLGCIVVGLEHGRRAEPKLELASLAHGRQVLLTLLLLGTADVTRPARTHALLTRFGPRGVVLTLAALCGASSAVFVLGAVDDGGLDGKLGRSEAMFSAALRATGAQTAVMGVLTFTGFAWICGVNCVVIVLIWVGCLGATEGSVGAGRWAMGAFCVIATLALVASRTFEWGLRREWLSDHALDHVDHELSLTTTKRLGGRGGGGNGNGSGGGGGGAKQRKKRQAFISYSHIDKDFAGSVTAALAQSTSFTPWVDSSIKAGHDWRGEIADAILSSSAMVFILSPNSASSRYCREEVYFAKAHNVPILTLVHDDWASFEALPSGMRLVLQRRQAMDCVGEALGQSGPAGPLPPDKVEELLGALLSVAATCVRKEEPPTTKSLHRNPTPSKVQPTRSLKIDKVQRREDLRDVLSGSPAGTKRRLTDTAAKPGSPLAAIAASASRESNKGARSDPIDVVILWSGALHDQPVAHWLAACLLPNFTAQQAVVKYESGEEGDSPQAVAMRISAATCVIVIVSPEFARSHDCLDELLFAHEAHKRLLGIGHDCDASQLPLSAQVILQQANVFDWGTEHMQDLSSPDARLLRMRVLAFIASELFSAMQEAKVQKATAAAARGEHRTNSLTFHGSPGSPGSLATRRLLQPSSKFTVRQVVAGRDKHTTQPVCEHAHDTSHLGVLSAKQWKHSVAAARTPSPSPGTRSRRLLQGAEARTPSPSTRARRLLQGLAPRMTPS